MIPRISNEICCHILMAGNYYKNHYPGGISSVVQYWEPHFEKLNYIPTWKSGSNLIRLYWFLSAYIRILIQLICNRKIKIVHLHTAADGSFWRKVQYSKLAKFFGKKIILHVHASRFKDFYSESSMKKRKWILEEFDRVDRIIALSDSWKKWFISIGTEEKKIIVLHNITAEPQKKDKGPLNGRKTRFLFLGEIGPRKGVFDILRTISEHQDELRICMELKIGGNNNEEKLIATINGNHIGDIVTFEGFVKGNKKIDLLNWADVYLLPSFNEGLPISILEAMSYGMPIISSPVGGIPEVVDSSNGILVTPGNDHEIYQAIIYYISNVNAILQQGKVSEEKVKSYLPEQVISHLKSIYIGMLN